MIRNPLTGRNIKIRGPTYNELLKKGIISHDLDKINIKLYEYPTLFYKDKTYIINDNDIEEKDLSILLKYKDFYFSEDFRLYLSGKEGDLIIHQDNFYNISNIKKFKVYSKTIFILNQDNIFYTIDSSSKKSDNILHDVIDFDNYKNNIMILDYKRKLTLYGEMIDFTGNDSMLIDTSVNKFKFHDGKIYYEKLDGTKYYRNGFKLYKLDHELYFCGKNIVNISQRDIIINNFIYLKDILTETYKIFESKKYLLIILSNGILLKILGKKIYSLEERGEREEKGRFKPLTQYYVGDIPIIYFTILSDILI